MPQLALSNVSNIPVMLKLTPASKPISGIGIVQASSTLSVMRGASLISSRELARLNGYETVLKAFAPQLTTSVPMAVTEFKSILKTSPTESVILLVIDPE